MTKISLIPRVSEKAYDQSQKPDQKVYVFEVPLEANKHTIARAVTAEYEVIVENVRTLVSKGKPKQSYRKGSRPQPGKRADLKKAYVTLKAGQALPIFTEEAEQEAKQAEAEAKLAKKEAKESKKVKKTSDKTSKENK